TGPFVAFIKVAGRRTPSHCTRTARQHRAGSGVVEHEPESAPAANAKERCRFGREDLRNAADRAESPRRAANDFLSAASAAARRYGTVVRDPMAGGRIC